MPDLIVVGTDGSDCADLAVDWAAGEAVRRGGRLHIVHAVEGWPLKVPRLAPPDAGERVRRAGLRVLEDAERRVRTRHPALETTTALATEDTAAALRKQSEGAFELVLGSRGHGGFADLLLGSTGLKAVAHSEIPVVIVRGETDDRGEVVVGLDLDRNPGNSLRYAFETASVRGARLRIVHAWQVYPTAAEVGATPDVETMEAELRSRVAAAYAPLRDHHPGVDAVDEVVLEHPVTALVNASRNACLVVVGEHPHSRVMPRFWSVGHGTVHHARCPVAVVPDPG
ncbi:universal stress protein [Spirillospora albida]|uniref:universal stress protein n=1 Tax=Spirillospora albida TaxID=58123 RepID=UPI0004BFE53C|nr:universal stress protein [Spirillospora albida]